MKDHFLKLFAYDKFVNNIMIEAMKQYGTTGIAEKTMAHLLAAQQVWLNRCKYIPPVLPLVLWPDWKLDTFQQKTEANNQQWIDLLNGLEAGAFEDIIAYKNSLGESHETSLTDIFTHVINHGTHHRAQIGQYLKQAGLEKLPTTDYVAFLRY